MVEQPWRPPKPEEAGWDWIRTTSGEWLKGDLTRLRDRNFEFDSDEFGDVEVDLEDVDYFRFGKPHTYRFRGRESVRGTAELRDGVVKIRTLEDEIVERDATQLVSISRGAGSELGRWSADVGVGATLRQGNTDQTDLSATADIQRETAFNRLRLTYQGAQAKADGDRTASNHRANAALDFFITWRLFATLPFFEYFTDQFQNIRGRYTPGLGLGYQIIDTSRVEWDVMGGGAYQRTVFENSANDSHDAALTFNTSLDLEITDDLDWDSSYALQLVVTDLGKTNHNLQSTLSFDVWGPVDFDFTFIWDRIEGPEKDSNGARPDRDDFRMTVGLAIDF